MAELPGKLIVTTLAQIQERFRGERWSRSRSAKWCADHPEYSDLCRYCGKRWRKWAGSKLDGHAKCVVGDDFKRWLAAVMVGAPQLTYAQVAAALGMSIAVVRSWVTPIAGR